MKQLLYRLLRYRLINLYDFAYARRSKRMAHLQRFQRRTGYSVIPVSYFEPVPDLRDVDLGNEGRDRILDLTFELDGAFLEDALQVARQIGLDLVGTAGNHMYGANDALAYFGMIRKYRPRRIVEIGSGHSALLADRAVRALGLETRIESIEPFPIEELRGRAAAGAISLIERRIEDIDGATPKSLATLAPGDILFIDTSHVNVRGGDTNFIFFRVLPSLRPGVIVHIHDVFLPYDYDRRMYYGVGRFYTEQYLLAAVLANGDRFTPLLSVYDCSVSDRGHKLPAEGGSAFWMKRN